MSSLKPALRLPATNNFAIDTSTPFPTSPPQLGSRFSAETLASKSTPLLQRVRQYTREHKMTPSPSTQPGRFGHTASSSTSQLNSSCIKRGGEDQQETLNGNNWGVTAAREIFGAIGSKVHSRKNSSHSIKSAISGQDHILARPRASKSFSSPSIASDSCHGSTARVQPAGRTAMKSNPRARTPDPLVLPPPRSDSRRGVIADQVPNEPTIAPLQPLRPQRPPPPPVPLAPDQRAAPIPTPFRALLVNPPSTISVRTLSPGSHLVKLNIGGTTFVSTVETLTRCDREAGRLAEYVEAVLLEVRTEGNKYNETPVEPVLDDDDADETSEIEFAGILASRYTNHEQLDDQDSPIDSLHPKLFLPRPAGLTFTVPPAPLTLDKTTGKEQNALLVRSPAAHLRIHSFHPDIVVPSPTTPRGPTQSKGPLTPLSPYSLKSDESDYDLQNQLQHAQASADNDGDAFERALGPFFAVLHGQQQREAVAAALDGHMPAQHTSRPGSAAKACLGTDGGTRTPSLSESSSTYGAPNDPLVASPPGLAQGEFEIFLDRSPEPYPAVFTWLRDGQLPPSISMPRDDIEREAQVRLMLSLSPGSALDTFHALRALEKEAQWLGMSDLVRCCNDEIERLADICRRVQGVVSVSDLDRRRRAEMMKTREKAGWI